MPRPRGRTKTARISVNFDPEVYGTLVLLAKGQDVPVAQIVRRAVTHLIAIQQAAQHGGHIPAAPATRTAATARHGR